MWTRSVQIVPKWQLQVLSLLTHELVKSQGESLCIDRLSVPIAHKQLHFVSVCDCALHIASKCMHWAKIQPLLQSFFESMDRDVSLYESCSIHCNLGLCDYGKNHNHDYFGQ